jgi:hypothetical protein
MNEPKLIKITQLTTFDANGRSQPSYLVQFSVDENGPFTIQVPGPDFSAANVKAAMDKFAAEIKQLTPGA